jgi:hypothetical protein
MTVPYSGYSIVEEVYMKYEEGVGVARDAIFFMLWRQNEGGTDKTFSR